MLLPISALYAYPNNQGEMIDIPTGKNMFELFRCEHQHVTIRNFRPKTN